MRSTGSFDGAGSGSHLAVLTTWAVGGLATVCASKRVESIKEKERTPVTV